MKKAFLVMVALATLISSFQAIACNCKCKNCGAKVEAKKSD